MKRILGEADLLALADVRLDSESWTAVIPVAGRGSRLGFSQPKALYPVLGRPLLLWILDLLHSFCDTFVLVVSPEGESAIRSEVAESRYAERVSYCVQSVPLGMADAVMITEPMVKTPNVLVIWGDQAALSSRTVEYSLKAHTAREGARLTLPTVMKPQAYIALIRDHFERIIEVKEAREQGSTFDEGENDCGLFLFQSAALFSRLREAREKNWGRGKSTGEFNLLPLLPTFDEVPGNAVTLRIASLEETIGINTPQEAEHVGKILEGRG